MINQYKRTDVFRCRLQSHRSFAGKVSAHHVLRVRKCLPEGCIYFKWRCRLLEKGATCAKGYNYPGKNCNSCRFYYEEKLHKVPEIMLPDEEYRLFLDELEEFEDWLGQNLGRRLDIQGRINHIGPRLIKTVGPRHSRLSLRGYLSISPSVSWAASGWRTLSTCRSETRCNSGWAWRAATWSRSRRN